METCGRSTTRSPSWYARHSRHHRRDLRHRPCACPPARCWGWGCLVARDAARGRQSGAISLVPCRMPAWTCTWPTSAAWPTFAPWLISYPLPTPHRIARELRRGLFVPSRRNCRWFGAHVRDQPPSSVPAYQPSAAIPARQRVCARPNRDGALHGEARFRRPSGSGTVPSAEGLRRHQGGQPALHLPAGRQGLPGAASSPMLSIPGWRARADAAVATPLASTRRALLRASRSCGGTDRPLLLDDDYGSANGQFYHRGRAIDPPRYTLGTDVQRHLWEVSERLAGLA